MSTDGTDTDNSLPALFPEDDLKEKTASQISQATFSDVPDIIFLGEGVCDGDFFQERLSKYRPGSRNETSRGSAEQSLLGEFWAKYDSYPAFMGEAGEKLQEEEEEEEEEEEDEEGEEEGASHSAERMKKMKMSDTEHRRRSLFVHSSPTHFPDINRARKSVFGSIFVRASGYVSEEAVLLKSVAESNYNMLQSMLNSFDRIVSSTSVDSDKKKTALAYRESMMKNLEMHGMSRTYSDGSVHWEIYPIAQNYLFSIKMGDHVHQTRNLSRIEDRIVNGTTQVLKAVFNWPTGSSWSGHWDLLGMAGNGEYTMPHGVSYSGNMQNGIFQDDDATLTYPNKFKALHCVYEKGELLDCRFQFPDRLMHDKTDWSYCKFPDRRFWSEVVNGLKPAKIAQKTEVDPPRKIPINCYDTSDGFYNPKTLMLVNPAGELLRVPLCEEDNWIKKYCRKAVSEYANFRPDLFENWFNYDQNLIESVLEQQQNFRTGKISFEELQQFYAENGLVLSSLKFNKNKSPSQVVLQEFLNSIPNPVKLKTPRTVKKYQGHNLPTQRDLGDSDETDKKFTSFVDHRPSKTFHLLQRESETKPSISQQGIFTKGSSISFRLKENEEDAADRNSDVGMGSREQHKRKVPQQFMRKQPFLGLKPPFSDKPKWVREKRPCRSLKSDDDFDYWDLELEGEGTSLMSIDRKGLEKIMRSLIMDIVVKILMEERERHRKRYEWAKKVHQTPTHRENPNEKCMKVLQELFASIPEREEYFDSDPDKSAYFKKLAEDKYNIIKYWGKRMYYLDFSGSPNN